jgi:TonB family protein
VTRPRRLSIAAVLVLSAASLLAQQSFRLVSPDKKFEASFPGQPKEDQYTSDQGPFHIEGRAYSFEDATAKFVLTYFDETPWPTDLKPSDALDAAISGTVRNVNGKLVKQESLTLRGIPAKSAQIAVGDNTIVEGQFLCVKPRIYDLLVLHRKETQPSFEQQFFDSFTIPIQVARASSMPSTRAAQDSKPEGSVPAVAAGHAGGQDVSNPGVYRVGGDVTPPKTTYAPDPEYSEEARKAKYEGSVVLWLVVSAGGLPQKIRVQRSLGMGLDEEAVKAVKQWRFQPATKDGQPVPVMINVQVNFRLYDDLYPHPDSASQPPRFPGANISEYPLVVRLNASNSRRDATGVTLTHSATVVEAGRERQVSISCRLSSQDCVALRDGTYPAKWQKDMTSIEILGLLRRNDSEAKWTKAVYTIAADVDLKAPAEGTAPVHSSSSDTSRPSSGPNGSNSSNQTTGQGGPQDYQEARERYEKAAAAGDAVAMSNLGNLYYYGHGVPQDYRKAREWYEKAAANGNAAAMRNLGDLYHNGQGVPQEYRRAKEWSEKAADAGDAVAMGNVGDMYYQGQGVPQDYRKAREWFEKAARSGNASAMINLAHLYYQGQGVPRSYQKSKEWLEKAAVTGNAYAQQLLTMMPSTATAPERAKGISMHMLPKRVADLGGMRWGLTVDNPNLLTTESEQPVLQTPTEFLSFVRKQDTLVQENGVWIVVTDPNAYSSSEKALLEDAKILCQKEKIPLFICRAAELPDGWKRYDQPAVR